MFSAPQPESKIQFCVELPRNTEQIEFCHDFAGFRFCHRASKGWRRFSAIAKRFDTERKAVFLKWGSFSVTFSSHCMQWTFSFGTIRQKSHWASPFSTNRVAGTAAAVCMFFNVSPRFCPADTLIPGAYPNPGIFTLDQPLWAEQYSCVFSQ